eukprot:356578-Amphidinium_carterae.1
MATCYRQTWSGKRDLTSTNGSVYKPNKVVPQEESRCAGMTPLLSFGWIRTSRLIHPSCKFALPFHENEAD